MARKKATAKKVEIEEVEAEAIEVEVKPTRVNLKAELAKQKATHASGYQGYIRARIKAGK